MKSFYFFSLVFTLFLQVSFAQDAPDAFADRINHIFQYVDKGQVSTGILQEYGIEFTNLNNYNGQALNDSNWVTLPEWRNIYGSLYSSQINYTADMPELAVINDHIDSLLVMHYHFNSIRTDAITPLWFLAPTNQF